jgi:hypothetical protein
MSGASAICQLPYNHTTVTFLGNNFLGKAIVVQNLILADKVLFRPKNPLDC